MTVGIAGHVARRTLGEPAAVVEHDEAVRDLHQRLHGVLDDDDGDAVGADAPDHGRHDLDAVLGEAGERLVEQHEARPRREAARQLHQAQLERGEAGRQDVAPRAEPHARERGAGERGGRRGRPAVGEGADDHVLVHRQVREEADDLERAPDTAAAHRVRRQPGDGLSLPADLAVPPPGGSRSGR
jgi:hypothetical protein